MAALGQSRLPVVMPHYPHMMREDTAIWTKFLQTTKTKIKEVWYDVHCGQAVVPNVGATDIERRVSAGVTRKRIDVVAAVGGGVWVIEIKPYANMFALGQIRTYVRLLSKEYALPGEAVPVIICNNVDPDILEDIDDFGILVITVS